MKPSLAPRTLPGWPEPGRNGAGVAFGLGIIRPALLGFPNIVVFHLTKGSVLCRTWPPPRPATHPRPVRHRLRCGWPTEELPSVSLDPVNSYAEVAP